MALQISGVVLIVTDQGIGSGTLISKDGLLLTNWHVIQGVDEIAIVFRPNAGEIDEKTKVFAATIENVDKTRDLALLRVAVVPRGRQPVRLGNEEEIRVGFDVHAIGHPEGQTWTYTRGYISQLRSGFEWQPKEGQNYKADVVQTQTPINPGNSGGPLLTDRGSLIGVNSFKRSGEALNFAVSVSEVRAFLASNEKRFVRTPPRRPSPCKAKILREGRQEDRSRFVRQIDTDCDGLANAYFVVPDDEKSPIAFYFDTKSRGKSDIVILDNNRDGKWDVSYHDTDFDGKIDLVGQHPDGKLDANSFAPYKKVG